MSIATTVGFLAGTLLCVGAILTSTDNFLMFLSVSSLVMGVGGTLANVFISNPGPGAEPMG